MPALYLVIVSALVAIIAYRTYGAFLPPGRHARRPAPHAGPYAAGWAGLCADAPLGALVHTSRRSPRGATHRPRLAAQFGYMPGFSGCRRVVIAGGVHDS